MPTLEPHPEALAGISAAEIITVVSGLPRSGTSLMMQILEAAGIPPFTDGRRQPDESNRKGYYEHDKVASLLSSPDRSWIAGAKGAAIKVVAPLLAGLPAKIRKQDSEPEPLHYRVLFMERLMEEVLQSQETMLDRLGRTPAASEKAADIAKAYRQQERHAKSWCAGLGIHAMSVSYEALVHHPDDVLPRIAKGPRPYTYWVYRAGSFHKNMGMRIDLVYANAALAGSVSDAWVDREARKGKGPSDHAPVIVDLSL